MNFTQLGYNLLTGQWRIDRERVKEQIQLNARSSNLRKMYAGAEPGTKRPGPNVLSTPEDFKQAYQRIILIRAARQMEEDFPFFDSILADFETYVVGDCQYMPSTGLPEADKRIRDYLDWQFNEIDISGRQDLCKMARVALRTMKRDGECGFIPHDTGDSIKLSCVSGDRIGNPLVGANIGPGNYNGIIVNEETGAPIQFEIYKRVPKLNNYVFQCALSPNDFIHYYDMFRFEQYHGVTVFKNAIEHAFDIKQILDFTKLNIKWRSSQLPYITSETGQARGSGYMTQPNDPITGAPQPLSITQDGVTQSIFKIGEGVVNYPNDFPNQQFRPLIEELKRDIAAGCKLPLEFCYRSETGGVVQRFYANKAERTFDEDKRWLKRTLLNPIKNRIIQKGIETGELQLGSLAKDLARFKGTWQMGRAVSVDYSKENDSDIKLIEAGLMSPDDWVSENGGDLATINKRIENQTTEIFKAAQRISEETGQDVALILPYLVKKFPNPGAGLKAAGESVDEPAPAADPESAPAARRNS